ncbi:hypothetical protein AJ78_05352 [Emergomyces pasteurianus Ep9510]|uniref:Zn(2)-C6 fungal-type domain-containing protein n=1 Tax=Emergomyces pasteurianus Ep9510 TaxID=1447872 RepID=A0A1J9Q260_9EURO|nr:hypothetical protein AJ78_05352 [Emergomyces pasteurianus Ep9510]
MSSYFPPDGPGEGHTSRRRQDIAKFAAPAPPESLVTPHYVNRFWLYPLQPQMPHPQAHHSHLQMASAPNDQRKHKRTRSGCFTCRSRRVKCDETHPICDRCSKGKRECVYPPPPVRRTGSRANPGGAQKHPTIPESESSDENNGCEAGTAENETTKEDQSHGRSLPVSRPKISISRRQNVQSLAKQKVQSPSETSSIQDRGASPISDTTTAFSEIQSPSVSSEIAPLEPTWRTICDLPGASELDHDVQFFLAYHRNQITFSHYFLRQEALSFVRNDIPIHALHYEPLLYAVVSFSAYMYSIRHPGGKLYTFLKYYNKSVTGLLKSLSTSNVHHDAMMLTILQLATFEEYLGDWVSVTDHHQAAHRMLTELYTPEKINENEFRRHMFLWYARFDVISSLLAGNEAILNREWYLACEKFAVEDELSTPGDMNKQLYTWSIRSRKLGMDMASLIAKMSRGLMTIEEFERQNQDITITIDEIQDSWKSLVRPERLVMFYENKVPLGPNDIVDPYVPGRIHDRLCWDVNTCLLDLIATRMMHKYQTGLLLRRLDTAQLQAEALDLLSLVETMERWPNSPKDAILHVPSPFALATLFIPYDERHIMWCRKKLAKVEQLGYIYPQAFRSKMAELWQLPELNHWWLPNEEGYPSLVREIRDWTSERDLKPRDTLREDIRDLKTMFWRMSVEDTSSAGSPSSNMVTPPSSGLYPEHSPSEPTP